MTLPVSEMILGFVQWILGLGTAGVVLFACLYFVAGMIMLPMFPIGVLAGMAYGMVKGAGVLLPGALLAAVLATVLGRTIRYRTLTRRSICTRGFRHRRQ